MARQTAMYLQKKQLMQKRVESAKAKFRKNSIPKAWKVETPRKVLKKVMGRARRAGRKLFVKRQLANLHENQCPECNVDMDFDATDIDWAEIWYNGCHDACDHCCCAGCGARKEYPGARCCI